MAVPRSIADAGSPETWPHASDEMLRAAFERSPSAISVAALDDFGVGYAAFTYLHQLPVDYLKIDVQFVRDMLNDPESRQIVHAIVGVARQLGLETIAEGVEDHATLDELRRIGVDYAQGFLIGRPSPVSQLWQPASPSASADG
jgi:EAL domain-containing protein (putative c-di-GMP-specific phosphodiesterase class I)